MEASARAKAQQDLGDANQQITELRNQVDRIPQVKEMVSVTLDSMDEIPLTSDDNINPRAITVTPYEEIVIMPVGPSDQWRINLTIGSKKFEVDQSKSKSFVAFGADNESLPIRIQKVDSNEADSFKLKIFSSPKAGHQH